MISKLTFATSIDASHEADSLAPMGCPEHLHGHNWEIRATFLYDPLHDQSFPRIPFEETVDEIDERHLNDMIRPSAPTTYGLAHWIMDRLASRTRCESVSVTVNAETVTVIADEVRRK